LVARRSPDFRSLVEEVELFAGVDWASQSHQVCLIDADRTPVVVRFR
jgi:hypothetical protein